jgi:chromosome segregation protein
MQITSLELVGFKSFGKKTTLTFDSAITGIVGPNGSGKSNVAEAIRFVLGEQSMKSMRGKQGTDLIFKGSVSLSPLGRASVTAIFDNKQHNKNTTAVDGVFAFLQYDEVRISREIYADGANEYLINDTKVRLKDIQELLSTASIGSSGHHMISQGEADRVLNASSRERKEMIEDALGLKLYQWRIKEAEKKLEKAQAHLESGELSRREIAPHLHFLKKQVERIEARKEQTEELAKLYNIFLRREDKEIEAERSALYLLGSSEVLLKNKEQFLEEIKLLEEKINKGLEDSEKKESLRILEEEKSKITTTKDELYRKILRFDAEEAVLQKSIEKSRAFDEQEKNKKTKVFIEKDRAVDTAQEIENTLDQVSWRLEKNEYAQIPNYIQLLKNTSNTFFNELTSLDEINSYIALDTETLEKEMTELHLARKEVAIQLEIAERDLQTKKAEVENIQSIIESKKNIFHAEEKQLYELKSKVSEIDRNIDNSIARENAVTLRHSRFLEELQEGTALIGSDILRYSQVSENEEADQRTQSELHRLIQRLKIKLEDSGVSNVSDILEEHRGATERDQFLLREIEDLRKTKEDLLSLISDLKNKLQTEFNLGIERINSQFNLFFTDMFGGGSASLTLVEKEKRGRKTKDDEKLDLESIDEDADVETESGIEVAVSLPQKKVRDLSMLSGGERALTSIALLFAISGVNPPPFMVLDETDAALDEANARRYGASLRSLAKHSKLIVITHNRETMNQADSLYGVTVGRDGASKILSVRFDEATEYAK